MNRIFPITHNTLIQPVASLIQCILQNKKSILTTTCLHDAFAKIFPSAPTHHPNTFFLSLIGGQAMASTFQALSLATRTHGSLSFPACSLSFQVFISSHAFVMSRSLVILIKPCLIWLKFIFQYIATLYLFLSLNFYVHILYALYKKSSPT